MDTVNSDTNGKRSLKILNSWYKKPHGEQGKSYTFRSWIKNAKVGLKKIKRTLQKVGHYTGKSILVNFDWHNSRKES